MRWQAMEADRERLAAELKAAKWERAVLAAELDALRALAAAYREGCLAWSPDAGGHLIALLTRLRPEEAA